VAPPSFSTQGDSGRLSNFNISRQHLILGMSTSS
jgi:hypothetical protein